MNEALKPYLARSVVLHFAAVAAFALLASRSRLPAGQVYMIDFVGGPSATLAGAGPAGAPAERRSASPAAVPRQADADAFRVRSNRRAPIALPRPSLLRGIGREAEPALSAPSAPSLAGAPGTGPEQAAAGPGGNAAAGIATGAGVTTDLPNFPYPWYISQVRLMLWQAWQKTMPRLDAEGSVVFAILRNGAITDLAVEASSGDPEFDRAALDSARAAAPFPALPSDFREPFLKIHLTLKSEEAWR